MYVQANALDQDQRSLEHGDADWPTIGLLVPAAISKVARRQMVALDPIIASNHQATPISPPTSKNTPSQYLQPLHPEQKDDHVGERKSIFGIVRRKISWVSVQGRDGV